MNDRSFENPSNAVYKRGVAVVEIDGQYYPISVVQDRTIFDPMKYKLALLAHEYPDTLTLNTKTQIIENLQGVTTAFSAEMMAVSWIPNVAHESPLFLGWNIRASVYNTDWSNSVLEIYRRVKVDPDDAQKDMFELISEGRFSGDINVGVLNFGFAIDSNIASVTGKKPTKAAKKSEADGTKGINLPSINPGPIDGLIPASSLPIDDYVKFTDNPSYTKTRIVEPVPMDIVVKCNNAVVRVTPVPYTQEIASALIPLGDNITAADVMRLVKDVIQ